MVEDKKSLKDFKSMLAINSFFQLEVEDIQMKNMICNSIVEMDKVSYF